MEQKISTLLPTQAQTTTDYDYILTNQEELAAIAHEVSILKAAAVRRSQGMKSVQEINQLLKTDFESKLNKRDVFTRYNVLKHIKNEDAENILERVRRLRSYKDEIAKLWVYGKFFNVIKQHFEKKNGNFIFDANNSFYIKAVCFFLARNSRFNTELGLCTGKGILVAATTGVGKTETIRAVKDNPLNPVNIYSMIDITDFVKQSGEFNLHLNGQIICLDDLGTEQPTVKYYGTEINWFKDFIEKYYLDEEPFDKLIITTNLTAEQIEERYGKRVRSRMREMFNLIAFKSEDLRK